MTGDLWYDGEPLMWGELLYDWEPLMWRWNLWCEGDFDVMGRPLMCMRDFNVMRTHCCEVCFIKVVVEVENHWSTPILHPLPKTLGHLVFKKQKTQSFHSYNYCLTLANRYSLRIQYINARIEARHALPSLIALSTVWDLLRHYCIWFGDVTVSIIYWSSPNNVISDWFL